MNTLLQALQPAFATAFTLWGAPVSWIEIAAFVLAVGMVLLNMRVHPLAWPLAIGSSLGYAALFQHSGLYGEAGLQLFFIAISLWGWWQWLHGTQDDGTALQVRRLGAAGRWRALAVMALSWPALALLLDHGTDSTVPWWDAFPTAASVIGQWLLARKYVENWPTWVLVNVTSVALFASKGLWLTVLLYALFVGLSVAGWRAWQRLAAAAPAAR